jgi:hypothetical protein
MIIKIEVTGNAGFISFHLVQESQNLTGNVVNMNKKLKDLKR